MPTIFYDHQKFTTQRYGGISRYFANLIHSIKGNPDFDYKLGLLYAENYYLKDIRMPLDNFASRQLFRKRRMAFYKINEKYCSYLVEKNQFDIFHPTYYDTYFFDKLKKPFVTTIHDMTYERLPEYFWAHDDLTHKKRLSIERADKIIAISETTRTDLLNYSNADPGKVTVIYHGIDLDEPLACTPVRDLPEKYLLFVGDRSGYKNFYLFIDAFKKLSSRYGELNVVLSGGGELAISERELISRLGLGDRVKHYNVSDNELNYLYQQALAFVYPSLHEGFGYPILEAYKAGCPVILSDTPCFREVAGTAALFFERSSEENLIAILEKAIGDDMLRKELVIKGQARLKDFPLQKSIDETLALYKTMA